MTNGTYPDRVTTLLRIFVAVPILIVLGGVSGGTWQWSTPERTEVVVAGQAVCCSSRRCC